jgi:hypothetical protein
VFEKTGIGKGKLETALAFAGCLKGRDVDVVAEADGEGVGFQLDDRDDGITPTDIRAKVKYVI